jgi:hypothetical protein
MKNLSEQSLHFPSQAHYINRSSSDAWMSDELILDTQKVWSSIYGRVIPVEEAVDILRNVRGLADVLWDIMQERMTP